MIFGVAYLVVHLLQVLLYALVTGRTSETRQAILRLAPGSLAAPALLIVAGFLDGFSQSVLWAVALAAATAWRSCAACLASECTRDTSWSATAS